MSDRSPAEQWWCINGAELLERECMRRLHVVGTGGEVPRSSRHIGSVLMAEGAFVFHVYEERT